MKILMLRGLPASGKSTYAKQLEKEGWIRVNNDDLRDELHNGIWSKENEKVITKVREEIIESALEDGKDVVVDNLNIHPKHQARLEEYAKKYDSTLEIKDFNIPVEICIERDYRRDKSVGKAVILKWHKQYQSINKNAEKYIPPEDKPSAILVDIDGTLAHNNGKRSFFDWARVDLDDVDEIIADIVRHYYRRDVNDDSPEPQIIVMSGRDSSCRSLTEQWLSKHKIPYDDLFMRAENDNRKDSIVKKELFGEHIRDNYRVLFVLDDRNQVVKMWREMGLKVLQVEDGDF